jgi:hypothetical protein
MGKVIKVLLATVGTAVVIYFLFRGISSWRQGYSWGEMDWAQRGHTSITDFFAASDIGKREILKDGKKCIEYYAYKDGLPVKTVCQK